MEEEPRVVVVVEWAEKLGRFRRPEAVRVRLKAATESTREIEILEPQPEETS